MYRPVSRREFLSKTALATMALAGTALLGSGGVARALSLAPMDAEGHRLFINRCNVKGDSYHQALLAEAKAGLPQGLDAKTMQAALAAVTCPVCGCPVTTGAE